MERIAAAIFVRGSSERRVMADFAKARDEMVERQLRLRGVENRRTLEAFRAVPREMFVPDDLVESAYEDGPLPIGYGQTISQPYIVALMIEAAGLEPGARVLEIGAGSGYAAAVLGHLAARVVSIERCSPLAELAAKRIARLGLDHVEIVHGDGSVGYPDEAPYDAILAAASGSHVPEVLEDQLEVGGTLVMPIGEPGAVQNLVRVRRLSNTEYDQEDLGPVRFVPLIGAEGWAGPDPGAGDGAGQSGSRTSALIARHAVSLPEPEDDRFAAAFDRFGDARIILLGEASHGTSEYYTARAAITRRLIERHGFSIVAVEADWPDAAWVDRFVRHRPAREGEEAPFQRFPAWMWRNEEVARFIAWLRDHNDGLAKTARAGFFGLDLYNLGGSIRAVIDYLDEVDPDAARLARERYACLQPWVSDPALYGRLALTQGYALCEAPVVEVLRALHGSRLSKAGQDGEEWFDAAANARLVKNAEAYYRAIYRGGPESWNVRDTHMFETLCQLLDARGPDSKAVVWAHNSHLGNAAFTEMGRDRDELNIGQLVKERFGAAAVAIGFGTHRGTVAAATDWDGEMEVKQVTPSLPESLERLCHDSGVERFLLDLRENAATSELRESLVTPRLQRFIGVIYRPETERWSHYADAVLPGQFDAWVWFDETRAVTPLPGATAPGEDDLFPSGL